MTTDEVKLMIVQKAMALGVDPLFALAIVKQESAFIPTATSPVGAMGLFQLMPATASDMGVVNPYDPEQNADGGLRYIVFLQNHYVDRPDMVLAAYNWGMGNLNRFLWGSTQFPGTSYYVSQTVLTSSPSVPQETRSYIRRVFENMIDLASDPALLGTGGSSIIPLPPEESGAVDFKVIAGLAFVLILVILASRR